MSWCWAFDKVTTRIGCTAQRWCLTLARIRCHTAVKLFKCSPQGCIKFNEAPSEQNRSGVEMNRAGVLEMMRREEKLSAQRTPKPRCHGGRRVAHANSVLLKVRTLSA